MRVLASSLLLSSVLCAAQAPAPAISFPKQHHNFGKIPSTQKVTYRFKVANVGTAPLQISKVVPSCGCTSTVAGQWYLKPGETSEVEISFNPQGFQNVVRKSVSVYSDDPATPVATLSFEADVVQPVMPSTTAVFFQDLVRSSVKKAGVKLASGNGEPVRVNSLKIPGAPYLAATSRPEGKDVVVDIVMDPKKVPSGRTDGVDVLTIHVSGSKDPLRISVQWAMKSSVVATPDLVSWIETAGKEQRVAVTLRQVDGRSFRILSAKSTNPMVRLEGVTKASVARHELKMVLSAEAKPGRYDEYVQLALDDPEQRELRIRVSAVLQ